MDCEERVKPSLYNKCFGNSGFEDILRECKNITFLFFALFISGCVTYTEVLYDAEDLVLNSTEESMKVRQKMEETICEDFDGRGSLFSYLLLAIKKKYPKIDSFSDVEIYSDGRCYYVKFSPSY